MNTKYLIAMLAVSSLFLTSCNDTADVVQTPSDNTTTNTEVNETIDETLVDEVEDGVMVGGAMMVPSMDIVDNAMNADNVTTLVAAVDAAGLVETLKSEGPFTVFAPTNSAFDALPEGTVDTLLLPENKEMLAGILTYHVVSGALTSDDLEDGMVLTSVQGEDLTVTYTGDIWYINGVEIQTADVISSNGVTFIIDSVLMPSEDDTMMDDEDSMEAMDEEA